MIDAELSIKYLDELKEEYIDGEGFDRHPLPEYFAIEDGIEALHKVLEQEPSKESEKCIWIKYDYRTICPRECGGESPYWRIPENMENLKYCPYCGKEIEVQE